MVAGAGIIYDQLQGCALFEGIDPVDLPRLLGCLDTRRAAYRKDACILRMGDRPSEIGVLLSGSVSLTRQDRWGNESLVGKLQPMDIFAESYAMAGGQPLRLNVTALETCEVLYLGGESLLRVCSQACDCHSRLLLNLTRSIAGKNLALTRKIELTSLRSTRDKLLGFLSQEALLQGSDSFSIAMNRQELADYLCVDRSAMSATLSRLQREGALNYHRNQFRLHSRAEL